MKQLFLIAVLAIISFSAQAQFVANGSGCDVEYRQICIDPATCTVSYPSTTWILAPAHTQTPLTVTSCAPNEIVGFEVRYASSTGCTNTPIMVDQALSGCPAIVHLAQMGACSCTSNPTGLDVHFNGINLHIDG